MSAAPDFGGPSSRVRRLRDPRTIRARAREVFDAACAGSTPHFAVNLDRLDDAAARTVVVIRRDYPDLKVPYHSRWRHFDVGGIDRWGKLAAAIPDKLERSRVGVDLAVTSVLLDAGSGPGWKYTTPDGVFARSEGLAVASFDMFASGALSGEAGKLQALTADTLAHGFQVGPDNPLAGAESRAALLRRLGEAIAKRPDIFGPRPRLGNLVDRLMFDAREGKLPAARVLHHLLDGLADAWPARVVIDGVNVGDVGRHPAATDGMVPFHKLSQWLAYSLLEPMEWLGIEVVDIDALTGLPEYRNGGLFLDTGVLALKDPSAASRAHEATSELVVEWRALTVELLDLVAVKVRALLGVDAASFPLAKVLQGGTWTAGRVIAAEKHEGGGPPLSIVSDGTVF
ncbi:MAG: URC4/urg3 family protein [Tagaea sp.]